MRINAYLRSDGCAFPPHFYDALETRVTHRKQKKRFVMRCMVHFRANVEEFIVKCDVFGTQQKPGKTRCIWHA